MYTALHIILYIVLYIVQYIVLYNVLYTTMYAALYTVVHSVVYTVFCNLLLLNKYKRVFSSINTVCINRYFLHSAAEKYKSLSYFVLGTIADTQLILYSQFLAFYFPLCLTICYEILRLLHHFRMLKISRLSD